MNYESLITECTHSKENWFNPVGIGEYISALSNATALNNKNMVI